MSNRTVRRLTDVEELSRVAAEEFVRHVQGACSARKRCTVALSGGFTPKLLYHNLTEREFRRQVDWKLIEFFWSDERAVPPNHPDSNFGMANENLLQPLGVSQAQIHRMQAERGDIELAAREYQAELARVCGVPADGEAPMLDLVLLGMGSDGHTASIFPNTPAVNEKKLWVTVNTVPKLHNQRMTMTPVILNRAAHILLLVAGADKATALAHVLEGEADPDEFPAQLIQPLTGTATWLVDEAAAKKLGR